MFAFEDQERDVEPPPPPPATVGVPAGAGDVVLPPESASAERRAPNDGSWTEAKKKKVKDERKDESRDDSNDETKDDAHDGTNRRSVFRAAGGAGVRYTLEAIDVRGNLRTAESVVRRYIPFRAGDSLDVEDRELELTRYRLLGTGFFREVDFSLRRGTHRGYAVLVVHVIERNTFVLEDAWMGLSADADLSGRARPLSAYGGLGVAETNLAGAGITLGGAVAFADRQVALRTRVVHPQIFGLPWTAEAHLLYASARDYFGTRNVLVDEPGKPSEQDYAVLPYRRFGTWVGAGRDVGVSSQLFGHYRLESLDADVPAAASDLVGKDIAPIDFQVAKGVSYLSSLRGTFMHDTRDEPYLTHQGVHLVAMMECALAPLGSDYSFVKVQGRLSRWYSLPWEHVLRAELFAGAIFGTAPFYDKFYVGDLSDLLPDRAIDLAFDRRPAPNWFGTRIAESRYGEYAARVNVEYRIPVYRGTRSVFGVDVFGASGVYLLSREKEWRLPPRGYDGFRAIPVDLTFNLGVRADTSVGAFSFGISNFIGFLPLRGEAQP